MNEVDNYRETVQQLGIQIANLSVEKASAVSTANFYRQKSEALEREIQDLRNQLDDVSQNKEKK